MRVESSQLGQVEPISEAGSRFKRQAAAFALTQSCQFEPCHVFCTVTRGKIPLAVVSKGMRMCCVFLWSHKNLRVWTIRALCQTLSHREKAGNRKQVPHYNWIQNVKNLLAFKTSEFQFCLSLPTHDNTLYPLKHLCFSVAYHFLHWSCAVNLLKWDLSNMGDGPYHRFIWRLTERRVWRSIKSVL